MRAWRLVLGKWSWSWGKSEQRSEIVDWTRHTTELFAALDKVFPRHNEFPRHCILIESGRPALSVYLKELNKFQIVYLDDAKVDEFNPHDPDLLIEQLYKLKQQIFSSIKA